MEDMTAVEEEEEEEKELGVAALSGLEDVGQ